MKTIYTTLPIYDKLAKQYYERSKHDVKDEIISIYCPLNQIPSFQWADNGDGCTSVTRIDLIDSDGSELDITSDLTLPALFPLTSGNYFIYEGGTLTTLLECGLHYLKIAMDNAKVYYSEWFMCDDVTDYLKIDFYNTCDFYNIIYQDGFTQSLWFKSEPMEETYPETSEGFNNGEGAFIPTFTRQTKTYMVKTFEMPGYMVDVFNRMKRHSFIQLTDLVGDVNDIHNLTVEHEWQNYNAFITLTFDYDETAVISGCCNNAI